MDKCFEVVKVQELIIKAVKRLKSAQEAHCSERGTDNEIAEANLTHYLSWSFIEHGYNVYPEFPASKSRLIDIVAFHNESSNWIALEAKNYLHANQSLILKDFLRLASLDEEKWVDGNQVVKVFVTFNRHPNLTKWWLEQDDSHLYDVKAFASGSGADEYRKIKKYLEKSQVVGSASWYDPEEYWVYDVLYAIFI